MNKIVTIALIRILTMDVKATLGVQRSTAPGLGWRGGKRRLPGGNGINERLEGVCQGLSGGT